MRRAVHPPFIQAIHLALIQRFAALALAARKVDQGDLAHLHGTVGVWEGGRRRAQEEGNAVCVVKRTFSLRLRCSTSLPSPSVVSSI
jgi:hypothetical protein